MKSARGRRVGAILGIAAAGFLLGLVVPGLGAATLRRQGTVEFAYGRYDIADPRFDSIYQSGGAALGFALTGGLFANFDVSLEIKTLSRTGTLTYTQEKTSFRLVPISLGLRYVYPGKILQPFAGGGLDYSVYYEKNPIGTTIDAARGTHVQGGAYLQFSPRLPILLVAKVKYVWSKAEEDGRKVDLGGLEYGFGLALAF
jgi:hypothetical protein